MKTYKRNPYQVQAVRFDGSDSQRGFLSEWIPGVISSKTAAYVPTLGGTKIASVGDVIAQTPPLYEGEAPSFAVYSQREFDLKFSEVEGDD